MALAWHGLLFDFDGVVADTEPVHWRAWAGILRRHGFELDWASYCAHCRGVAASRAAGIDVVHLTDCLKLADLVYSALELDERAPLERSSSL